MSNSSLAPRLATAIVLLAAPLAFIFWVAADPGAAWRARYSGMQPGEPEVVLLERQVAHAWGRRDESVPGELDLRELRAQWDTCVYVQEGRDIALQLVAEGEAALAISGNTELRVVSPSAREARGKIVHFDKGWHRLRIDFTAGKHPSVALNASLDGRSPLPLGSQPASRGFRIQVPQLGATACP